MIDNIRLSDAARSKLIRLKAKTGIQHWNVLCRWAFCLSLAEASTPPDEDIPFDSSLEMSWRTFTGGQDEVYRAVLVTRAIRDGIPLTTNAIQHYFRLHLHRGISYLASQQPDSIASMVNLGLRNKRRKTTKAA